MRKIDKIVMLSFPDGIISRALYFSGCVFVSCYIVVAWCSHYFQVVWGALFSCVVDRVKMMDDHFVIVLISVSIAPFKKRFIATREELFNQTWQTHFK
jgi:hypothetical protein